MKEHSITLPFLLAFFLHFAVGAVFSLHKNHAVEVKGTQVLALHSIDLRQFSKAPTQHNNLQHRLNELPNESLPMNRDVGTSLSNNAPNNTLEIKLGQFQVPSYPRQARLLGQEGKVKIKISYDEEGHITKIDLLNSSGIAALDKSVLSAASQWKLEKIASNQQKFSPGSFEKSFEFKLKN